MDFSTTGVESTWQRICERMRGEVGEMAFKSWVKPMVLGGVKSRRVRMIVPTPFFRDWVTAHYKEKLVSHWSDADPMIEGVDILVGSFDGTVDMSAMAQDKPSCANGTANGDGGMAVASAAPATSAPHKINGVAAVAKAPATLNTEDPVALSGRLDPRYTFDNFVVGKPNEFAHAAAKRVAESHELAFNPLFLHGGVGLGKTHLMHAIGWEIARQNPERSVVYMSAEKFMYRFIRSLRDQNTMDFKEAFRAIDVLMIDDMQFISGKEYTQEEFFHTFNALVDQGRQIVLSADKSPSDLQGIEERLKSRLNCGLVADIHATTYELRLGILHSKADQKGVEIPGKILEFLAHRISANVRELEGALNRVMAHTQLMGRPLTLDSVQEVLQDLLRANDRRVTVEEIQKKVAEYFSIRVSDMHSARRARSVARPRQVAMYLAKQLTPRSLPEIGRKFGGRDHTTVMHAVRKVEELRERDDSFNEDVELLRRMLEA